MMANDSNPSGTVKEYHKSKKLWFFIGVLALGLISYFSGTFDGSEKKAEAAETKKEAVSAPVDLAYFARQPKSNEPPAYLRFSEGQDVCGEELRTDIWSREFSVPPSVIGRWVDWEIDVNPPNGYFLLFKDGTTQEVRADQKEVKDFGFRHRHFRILGRTPGQKATVTITLRRMASR